MNSILTSRWTKVVVFIACLVPLTPLVWPFLHALLQGQPLDTYITDPDPIKWITHTTGTWTLLFVVFTLAVTPLRKTLHLPQLIRFRRMLGLFAFFYGFLHFSTWIVLDKFFAWDEMWKDVLKRPFITVGFAAFVLMIPLAVTSTAGWIRRLGGKRWQRLHRLIYATAVLGVIHYYWLVKSDKRQPLLYAFIVAVLLAWRLGAWLISRRRPSSAGGIRHETPVTAESA